MLGISFEQTRLYQDLVASAEARGKQEGKQEGQASLMVTMLSKRFGKIPAQLTTQIETLSLKQIAALSDAFFNFNSLGDLANWLQTLSLNQNKGNLR